MTIGGSIALIALGAILRYAISWSPTGINVPLIGAILMIVGAIGLLISLAFLFSRRRSVAGPPPPAQVYERRQYSEPPAPGRYVEERRYSEPPGGYGDPPL